MGNTMKAAVVRALHNFVGAVSACRNADCRPDPPKRADHHGISAMFLKPADPAVVIQTLRTRLDVSWSRW